MPTYFITAIDTDSGKTIATGLLAKEFMSQGFTVVTMKIAQTGCVGVSDDVVLHRQLMGMEMTSFDKEGITCPFIYSMAAAPHLAAKLEGEQIDTKVIIANIQLLQTQFDVVLIEGVGGLMVPLNHSEMVLDFVMQHKLSVILVTSPKLGSLNHTFLTLEVCHAHLINVHGLIYNQFPVVDQLITNDSRLMIQHYSKQFYPDIKWGELPVLNSLDNADTLGLLYDITH